ncbi:Subtilase family protein [Pedobacter steynii]|uniref:Subtilase family protein n=1 Tax=Pedobacter steynii TaxID=430522 RepID=A0A1G9KDJ9_9SPHI|nr:S8 family serine peptidase [Pedobacter steynii]NQX38521.1 S8 family serine peptidase [Pedobacter steynii]SDL47777.1 Subtilase family protein [Pedobacter steynii]
MNKNQVQSERKNPPVWIKKVNSKAERLLSNSYRKDQILLYFKKVPTTADINIIKVSFRESGFLNTDGIKISSCGNCKIPVQLWSAKGIHTLVNTDSVRAGSGPKSTTVGESYSLNFLNTIPERDVKRSELKKGRRLALDANKEEIIVAVLDTGIDTDLIDPVYLWEETAGTVAGDCYKDQKAGWNFVSDNADFRDDHAGRHGSVVSQYIINEFKQSKENRLKIMPLKTHDKNGEGDLFGIICAIHFAIAKGAQLINASWGFYYYYELPIPYLKTLISNVLRKQGILFVTASGNKIDAEDALAKQLYLVEHGLVLTDSQLRNLEIHNFYPAHLSTITNSVVTVTTTDGTTVSASQNYSKEYADLGVLADQVSKEGMKFKLPFDTSGPEVLISGSSFATAIATGLIGANCTKSLYVPNIKKADFLSALKVLMNEDHSGHILVNNPALARKHIRDGACVK